MTTHKIIALLILTALATVGAGCSEFEIKNNPPIARAQVLVNGIPANLDEPIAFSGQPLAITLDGTLSEDEDGRVVSYLWLKDVSNAERYGLGDAGMLPPFASDPVPGQTSQLSLGEGTYRYSLWVTDNEKLTSDPATVSFTIETPTTYMPDAMCVEGYTSTNPRCEECVCTPSAMMGCLESYQVCFQNQDAMFLTLCSAVVSCALRVGCTGQGCYTAAFCMAEIDAAATYMGGTLADCAAPDAASSPCAAATQLGTCSSAGACMVACSN